VGIATHADGCHGQCRCGSLIRGLRYLMG
jgi:hypothetical protein